MLGLCTRFVAAGVAVLSAGLCGVGAAGAPAPPQRPNVILIYADDISARELPVYGSSVWSDPAGKDTDDPAYRATTPVLDRLADEGFWVANAWAATVCSPSRAMMMTGRFAHLTKWWQNSDLGRSPVASRGKQPWPLYESSPRLLGHVARDAGYGTFWAGKTQMKGSDLQQFGFDEGCFTPGEQGAPNNPHTDFKIAPRGKGDRQLVNHDTGEPADTYQQFGWYWKPHVRLMNHPDADTPLAWWPNTPESEAGYGLNTFGPDVELDFIFDYMTRQAAEDKPFFVYHTTHLGHAAFDWFDPGLKKGGWIATPIVTWDGSGYTRQTPNITGDGGVYEMNGSVSAKGIHSHVNYLDYQVWQYLNKLDALGIADNTVLIFCADNGTSGYGKASPDRQKGTHVPLIVYGPGVTKQGRQDALVSMADMLPTLADLTGGALPDDYAVDGQSLTPFLFGDAAAHRDWLYADRGPQQLIRGDLVMKDGNDKWWDVAAEPDDLISFPQITDWDAVSADHRAERDELMAVMPRYDVHARERDAPGAPPLPAKPGKKKAKGKKK